MTLSLPITSTLSVQHSLVGSNLLSKPSGQWTVTVEGVRLTVIPMCVCVCVVVVSLLCFNFIVF